ncbi:MAG: IclR family transcriptional regulator [Firmicutes bacterium]|nr:IclR family transcriptional regulator [Bacillota bacterium]
MSALDRALRILYHVSQQGESRISDIAADLELDKSVVSRLCKKLADWGLLEQEPKSKIYRLGPYTAWLGARYLACQDLRQLARPLLIELSQKTGRTVGLVLLSGHKGILIDKVDGSYWLGVSANIGEQMPLYYRAACKAILAYLPAEEISAVLAAAEDRLPCGKPFDRAERLAELARIRATGYSISREEADSGVTGIGAPIFDADGKVIAAVSVATVSVTLDGEEDEARLAKMVAETAATISSRLGFVQDMPIANQSEEVFK